MKDDDFEKCYLLSKFYCFTLCGSGYMHVHRAHTVNVEEGTGSSGSGVKSPL